jgi:hypothetical protein
VENASLPMLAKMSELQAAAVASMIASATLSAADQAELSTIAISVPWTSDADIAKVLNALAVAAPLAPGKRRRAQQDYMSVHHYLTKNMWEGMLDGTVPSDTKLTAFMGHCIHLGMRCPTEPTLKWLCSLWLVCCTDPGDLARMSVIDKTLKFKQVKLSFNQYRLRASDPPVWVDRLPATPLELLRDFPLVYRLSFPTDATPVPPGVSADLISGFDMSYSCRGGLKTPVTFGSGASSSSAVVSSAAGSGMDIERLLMTFMQGMQQSQQHMMQNVQQSQQQLMLHPKPATTLAALEDRSYRQAGMMGFEQPPISRQRTTPLFEEVPESPPAKAPASAFAVTAAPESTVAVYATEAAAAPAPAEVAVTAPPAGGDISELFGMLQDRKDDAKTKAAEAKAAKAAATKAEKAAAQASVAATSAATAMAAAAGTATVVDAGKVTGKNGKSPKAAKAAAAKAAASATAAAKTANPVPAAKSAKAAAAKPVPEADAASERLLSAADKVALAKARAKGGARKLKVSDGWGCSKCRWRFDGCSQCKNKTFTGFVWNPSMKG